MCFASAVSCKVSALDRGSPCMQSHRARSGGARTSAAPPPPPQRLQEDLQGQRQTQHMGNLRNRIAAGHVPKVTCKPGLGGVSSESVLHGSVARAGSLQLGTLASAASIAYSRVSLVGESIVRGRAQQASQQELLTQAGLERVRASVWWSSVEPWLNRGLRQAPCGASAAGAACVAHTHTSPSALDISALVRRSPLSTLA